MRLGFIIKSFMKSNCTVKIKLVSLLIFLQFSLAGQGIELENMPQSIKLTKCGRNVTMFSSSNYCLSEIEPYLKSLKNLDAYNQYNKAFNPVSYKVEDVSFVNGLIFGSAAMGTIGQSINRGKVFAGIAIISSSIGLVSIFIKKCHLKKSIRLYNKEIRVLKMDNAHVE
jgi:hypothetical protein